MKIKNGKKTRKNWSTVRRKFFEMILKTVDWKAIWNFVLQLFVAYTLIEHQE